MTDDRGPEADGGVTVSAGVNHGVGRPSAPERVRRTATVGRHEYRLAVRNRWALALTGVFALFALLLVAFGGSDAGPGRVDALVVSLASLATYLLPLAALAFGYDAVVGADEAGRLDALFALPVARSSIVAGAYLGRAVALAAATLIGFGLAGVAIAALAGVAALGTYLPFLFGAVGVGLAFLAVGVLVSTVAAERTHALGAALAAWVWFVFVHDLLALAVVAAADPPGAVVSAFVLANPADVFRVLVLSNVGTTGGGVAAALAATGIPTSALVAALAAWCVGPVLIAGRLVARRSV